MTPLPRSKRTGDASDSSDFGTVQFEVGKAVSVGISCTGAATGAGTSAIIVCGVIGEIGKRAVLSADVAGSDVILLVADELRAKSADMFSMYPGNVIPEVEVVVNGLGTGDILSAKAASV